MQKQVSKCRVDETNAYTDTRMHARTTQDRSAIITRERERASKIMMMESNSKII